MKAIIVEDSLLARDELKALLKPHSNIHIVGEAGHPDEAEILLKKLPVDLIFLDIHMPGRDGFDLLESIDCNPAVIFTTAYSEYAIQSFDYNTVDYLVKPIHPEKLARAILKIDQHVNTHENTINNDEQPLDSDSRIFIRDGENCHLVALLDMSRFEVYGNYARVFFSETSCLISKSLNKLETKLPPKYFFRANRQTIINIKFVKSVEPWINGGYQATMLDGTEVEISRRHSSRFNSAFGF